MTKLNGDDDLISASLAASSPSIADPEARTQLSRSAKEIHKDRSRLWSSSIERHSKYINPITGLFDEKYTTMRNCPVCEGQSHSSLFTKEGGSYVICAECKMVFLNPVLTPQALNDYYNHHHDLQSEVVANDSPFYARIYNEGLELLSRAGVGFGRILDFGCSAGSFLDLARKAGWRETVGIELNQKESPVARSKGHIVYSENIDDLRFAEPFDAITLWDVFEHLVDGSHYLQIFRRCLAPHGALFLQVPNVMGLAPRIMREHCNMFDGLEHVNLYSSETLRRIARKNGFEVVEMTSVIPELGVLSNYVHYQQPYQGDMPATDAFLGFVKGDDLLKQLLGYKLQVVLQRLA